MRRRRSRGQAGFTMTEMAVAMAVLGGFLASFGRVFTSTQGLSTDSSARIRAHEEHRKSIEALGDAVRGASVTTFLGFAEDGTSTNPYYRRVSGLTGATRTYEAVEQLRWVSLGAVNGATNLGRVLRIQNGIASVIADRVPPGGFLVTLQGNVLGIRLTTTYVTSQRKVASVTGEVQVSLRN